MKVPEIIINMRSIFTLLLIMVVIGLPSCSKNNARGKWVESNNGIKVYVPKDFEKKYNPKTLNCECQRSEEIVPLYTPPFKITVQDKQGKTFSFSSLLPTIIPDSLLRYGEKGSDNTYWYIAGKLDKNGDTQDYAFQYKIVSDSILSKYEYGHFKNNDLIRGYRYTYYPDSGKARSEWGRFKDNKIYQGYSQYTFPDSVGKKYIALWDADGTVNPTYLQIIRNHYSIMKWKGYDVAKPEKSDIALTKRYFFWENYKWYFFIGLSVIGILFILIGYGFIPESKIDGKDNPDYLKLSPWTCKGAYLRWIFFPLGLEYVYLRMQKVYLWTSLLSWTLIVASSKFIVLYGLTPQFWIELHAFDKPWQFYLFQIRFGLWLGSLIWIPYWVYLENFHTFRRNIYEKLIIGNQTLKYKSLCERISKGFKEDHSIIRESRNEAERIYNTKLGTLSKWTSWATNSKVEHARNKAESLNAILSQLAPIAANHAKMTSELLDYLNIERRNAYRNMIQAKELIYLIRHLKDNKSALKSDYITGIRIEQPTDIHTGLEGIKQVDFQNSAVIGFNTFDKTFGMMKDLGLKDSDSLLVSLGVGSVEFAIDSIGQINQRRTQEREHYEYQASEIVTQICSLDRNILDNDKKLLRANEIMQALSAANEAFVRAYVPLRDYVFGRSTSYGSFLKFVFKRHKKNAKEKVHDIAHLIQVCSLYNKINQSKI